MPYIELLLYLKLNGDEIDEWPRCVGFGPSGIELRTRHGHRYVRAQEGTQYSPHYIWVRV